MTRRRVPVDNKTADWPRRIAEAINEHAKALDAKDLGSLGDYANDAAAAAGGVVVGGFYRNGSVLMVRVS